MNARRLRGFCARTTGISLNPVTVFGLSNAGLWTVSQTSADGNVLADEIRDDRKSVLARRVFASASGMPSDALPAENPPGLTALKALGEIGMTELRSPGRKLLIWVGPGWGVGSGRYFHSLLNGQQLFDAIVWFSTLLREARITLYSTSVGEAEWDKSREILYRTYLAGREVAAGCDRKPTREKGDRGAERRAGARPERRFDDKYLRDRLERSCAGIRPREPDGPLCFGGQRFLYAVVQSSSRPSAPTNITILRCELACRV